MAQIIETMTIQELYQRMRELGLKTSVAHISDAIEQGVYPFASCVKGSNRKRIFEIYTKLFEQWVYERARSTEQEQTF